jgi:hypothetical protein
MSPTCAALLTIQSVAAYAMQQRREIIAALKPHMRAALKQELSDLVGHACKMATLYQTLAERAQAGLDALNAAPDAPAPALPTKAENQEAAIIGWQQSVLLVADPEADLDAALAALDAVAADPDDDIIF